MFKKCDKLESDKGQNWVISNAMLNTFCIGCFSIASFWIIPVLKYESNLIKDRGFVLEIFLVQTCKTIVRNRSLKIIVFFKVIIIIVRNWSFSETKSETNLKTLA